MQNYGGMFIAESKGYPYWSYWSSLLNAGLVMPGCLLLALVAAAERENGDGNGYNFNAFFSDDVLLPPLEIGSRVQFWVAAGNAECSKTLYDGQMEVWLAVHHAITIAGNVLCLAFPMGNVLAAVNSAVAELGSTCYNLYAVGVFPKLFFVVGMTLSNVTIVLLTIMLCKLDLPLWMQALYVVMCTLILMVRTVGVVGEVSTGLLSSPNELELNESDGAGMGVGGTREGKEQGATEETASVATASLKRRKVGKQVKELGGPMKMSVQLVNLSS
eukprot:gene13922-15607_t